MFQSVARFIVQNTQCADVDAARRCDWNASVEASFWPIFHIWSVTKSGILGEVVDDVRECGGVAVLRVGALVRGQVGGGFAYGQAAWNLGEAQP